jgi:hypothetical protein
MNEYAENNNKKCGIKVNKMQRINVNPNEEYL